jgi:phosphate transport system substrate-binding protein
MDNRHDANSQAGLFSGKLFALVLVLYIIATQFVCAAAAREVDDGTPLIDHNIPLWPYTPFDRRSRVALLEEAPVLKLTGDLPVLDGATALYPVYSAFVRAVYPRERNDEYNYLRKESVIRCTGTPSAYERLLNGEADIIFCARPSDEQWEKARQMEKTFTLIPIGKEAFVFFVNSNNPVANLTTRTIQNIYSGEVKNWKEILEADNMDKEIIAYQRPENSGSQTILEHIMGNVPVMPPLQENMIASMGGMFQQVAAYKNYDNAIGYSFFFFSKEMVDNRGIKLLAINDVFPNRENIANEAYPYVVDFYAITLGNETENTSRLIEWILSDQGQYLIEKTGYVPVK